MYPLYSEYVLVHMLVLDAKLNLCDNMKSYVPVFKVPWSSDDLLILKELARF